MAAAARSFWKGHLRLALVNIPIRLISATASEDRISLHQVDRKSKQRIRYQKVAGEGGRIVPQADIVQGFQLDDGSYVLLESDELDALKLNSRHTVELQQFVDAGSIDSLYFDNAYFVLPDGEVAEEGYRVIRDALRQAKKIGIGQLTMRGREHLVALQPHGDGLVIETLRYASEVRDADDVFSGIGKAKLKPELIAMAKQLIGDRSKGFDASQYENHYAEALRNLVKAKRAGGETVDVAGGDDQPSGATVIDFMEALRQSTGKSAAVPAAKNGKGGAKRAVAASAKRDPVKRAPASASRAKSKSRR